MGFELAIHRQGLTSTAVKERLQPCLQHHSFFQLVDTRILDIPKLPKQNGIRTGHPLIGPHVDTVEEHFQHHSFFQLVDIAVEKTHAFSSSHWSKMAYRQSKLQWSEKMSDVWHNKTFYLLWRASSRGMYLLLSSLTVFRSCFSSSYRRRNIWVIRSARVLISLCRWGPFLLRFCLLG